MIFDKDLYSITFSFCFKINRTLRGLQPFVSTVLKIFSSTYLYLFGSLFILAFPYRDVLIAASSPFVHRHLHILDWLARLQFLAISQLRLVPVIPVIPVSSPNWLTDWVSNWLTDGLTNWLAVQVVFNFNKYPVHVSKRDSWQLQRRQLRLRFSPIFPTPTAFLFPFSVLAHCCCQDVEQERLCCRCFWHSLLQLHVPLSGGHMGVLPPPRTLQWQCDIAIYFIQRRRVTLSFHLFLCIFLMHPASALFIPKFPPVTLLPF